MARTEANKFMRSEKKMHSNVELISINRRIASQGLRAFLSNMLIVGKSVVVLAG
jgi:hypothetical protein